MEDSFVIVMGPGKEAQELAEIIQRDHPGTPTMYKLIDREEYVGFVTMVDNKNVLAGRTISIKERSSHRCICSTSAGFPNKNCPLHGDDAGRGVIK